MKVQESPRSGKCGKFVAFRSRYGQCERQHTLIATAPTAAQCHAQSDFGRASLGWNDLTDEQRAAWRARGRKTRSHPHGGQCGPLTGQNLLTAINRNQSLLGLPPFAYPPERPVFGPNPVAALAISACDGRVALKLTVSRAPGGDVLLYASCPYNAGREYCDKFTYLGLLPAPVNGESDITALYLMKHAEPKPGSRVFLEVAQQVNGWRDPRKRIEAVFSASKAVSFPSKRRSGAAPGR